MSNSQRLTIIEVAGTILAINDRLLTMYPAFVVDEAWFAGRARTFIKAAPQFGLLDAGAFDRFAGRRRL